MPRKSGSRSGTAGRPPLTLTRETLPPVAPRCAGPRLSLKFWLFGCLFMPVVLLPLRRPPWGPEPLHLPGAGLRKAQHDRAEGPLTVLQLRVLRRSSRVRRATRGSVAGSRRRGEGTVLFLPPRDLLGRETARVVLHLGRRGAALVRAQVPQVRPPARTARPEPVPAPAFARGPLLRGSFRASRGSGQQGAEARRSRNLRGPEGSAAAPRWLAAGTGAAHPGERAAPRLPAQRIGRRRRREHAARAGRTAPKRPAWPCGPGLAALRRPRASGSGGGMRGRLE